MKKFKLFRLSRLVAISALFVALSARADDATEGDH